MAISEFDIDDFKTPSPDRDIKLADLRNSCTSNGFFQIRNHGIPKDLQDEVLRMAQELYALPVAKKSELHLSRSSKNRGYSGLAQQQLDPNAAPDLKESFYLSENTKQSGNQYPSEDDVPGFTTITSTYYDAMIQLSQRIFQVLALALGIDEHIFDAYSGADGTVSSTFGSTLRLVHYPSSKGLIEDSQFSCGAHTDFGFLTLLLQDGTPGLEVQDRSTGKWVEIPAQDDVYIVNLGDLMQRCTNGFFKSAPHRVMFDAPKSRYSVPFFFNGNHDMTVRCLEPKGQSFDSTSYAPITVGEHIRQRTVLSHVDL